VSAGDSDALAGREMLRVRNGRGDATTIEDAVIVYVWGSRGILRATQDGLDELRAVSAEAVALHDGTARLLAELEPAAKVVRDGLPDARLWVGLGIDGTIDAYRAGKLSAQQVIARYTLVAALCQRLGVEVLVLNGEGKWALEPGDVRTRDDMRALADQLGRAMRVAAPDVVLALSSFGRLGYHARVRPLIEGLTPHCSIFTGQSYAARAGDVKPGVLPAVIAADERSQDATERQGWHRDDTSEGGEDDSHDDLDRIPTVQAHKTAPLDLARVLVARPFVLVWSVPTIAEGGRADAQGLEAMRVAAAIRRYAPPRVENFQRAHGLKADGVLGPITYARALAASP
jgi:hypothetical protein